MDRSTESACIPPGFRFHPTDEELVGYYLKKKVASQKIDLDVIKDIDLYRIEPWDFQEKCWIGYEEQNEWYFFSHKDKKYPTGTRTNRATMAGFWKATGRDKAVYDRTKLIGMRKTLVFYKGRAPNGHKSDWIMHEYRLKTNENGPSQEEGWIVCRAFKKRTTASIQSKSINISTTNIISQSLSLKQELESPSLFMLQRPNSSISSDLLSDGVDQSKTYEENISNKKVRDWKALDKFIASQLSHGYNFEAEQVIISDRIIVDQGFGTMHHHEEAFDVSMMQNGDKLIVDGGWSKGYIYLP